MIDRRIASAPWPTASVTARVGLLAPVVIRADAMRARLAPP